MMKHKNISPEQIQDYICRGAIVHPDMYYHFLHLLYDESLKNNICMTPEARLEYYSLSVDKKIYNRINVLLKKVA